MTLEIILYRIIVAILAFIVYMATRKIKNQEKIIAWHRKCFEQEGKIDAKD